MLNIGLISSVEIALCDAVPFWKFQLMMSVFYGNRDKIIESYPIKTQFKSRQKKRSSRQKKKKE